ncbi:transposase [Halarsenatibacter silvermanii]|nr:transposase [Halarsenatibacter silvermanii]
MFSEYEEDETRGFGDFEYNLPESKQDQLNEGWPGIFYRKIFKNIDESKFKVLFSENMGRPNFPVQILIALEILRQLFDFTDKEVVDSFNYDVRFMKAVGLKRVGQLNLTYRTVYEFRDRIVEHANKTGNNLIKEVFEELTDALIEIADLETEIQKMDSTMVDANIKNLSSIELMRRTLDNFVSDLNKNQKGKIHKNVLTILSEEKFQEYLDEYTKKEIREILLGKIKTVKQHFKNDDEVNSLKSYELLCRLVDDQTIEAGGELKDDEDISADSL